MIRDSALRGTETRGLLFMDGSLYAGIGDWEDPGSRIPDPQRKSCGSILHRAAGSKTRISIRSCPAAGEGTIRRSPRSGWRISITTRATNRSPGRRPHGRFLECGQLAEWSVAQKTVISGSVGAQGTWTTNLLVPTGPAPAAKSAPRVHTDICDGEEMAFAAPIPQLAPSPASSRAGSTRPATPSCRAEARRRGPSA